MAALDSIPGSVSESAWSFAIATPERGDDSQQVVAQIAGLMQNFQASIQMQLDAQQEQQRKQITHLEHRLQQILQQQITLLQNYWPPQAAIAPEDHPNFGADAPAASVEKHARQSRRAAKRERQRRRKEEACRRDRSDLGWEGTDSDDDSSGLQAATTVNKAPSTSTASGQAAPAQTEVPAGPEAAAGLDTVRETSDSSRVSGLAWVDLGSPQYPDSVDSSSDLATAQPAVIVESMFPEQAETSAQCPRLHGILEGLGYVEFRAGSWDGAADGVIDELKRQEVKSGQVISIDAHNNSPDCDAIFSAHFSKSLPDQGPLDINYYRDNTGQMGWEGFYKLAAHAAEKKSVISMTGSCNCDGRAVNYVFYNQGQPSALSGLTHVEARGGTWNEAAERLLEKLSQLGVKQGQIVWIDAHNNNNSSSAIFCAHFSCDLPILGTKTLTYEAQNHDNGWNTFYSNALHTISTKGLARQDLASITASCNSGGRAVMYVFYYEK